MPSVVLEQVDREGNLKGRLLPRLSRLSLEQLGEVLIVVEQPVTQTPYPFAPADRSERLPSRLVAPQLRDVSGHLPGAQIGQRGHHRSIRRRGSPRSPGAAASRSPTEAWKSPSRLQPPSSRDRSRPSVANGLTARSAMRVDTMSRRIDIGADSIKPGHHDIAWQSEILAGSPIDHHACDRVDAVVSAAALRVPALDDLRASAGARSQPVPLLHPWKGSSGSPTAPIHASERCARMRPIDRRAAASRGSGRSVSLVGRSLGTTSRTAGRDSRSSTQASRPVAARRLAAPDDVQLGI